MKHLSHKIAWIATCAWLAFSMYGLATDDFQLRHSRAWGVFIALTTGIWIVTYTGATLFLWVRRIRFHLFTLLLLYVLGAAFVGANLVEHEGQAWRYDNAIWVKTHTHGWPISSRQWTTPIHEGHKTMVTWEESRSDIALILNPIIGLTGLALIGYVSERVMRRRGRT